MGIELVLAGVSAVAGIFSAFAQADAQSRAAGAAAQAADAQREARSIEAAQNQIGGAQSRRERIREERIRRARIIAAAQNQGASGSSGESGAVSSLRTNLSTLISNSRGESRAAAGINANMQRAADFTAQSNLFQQQGQTSAAFFNTIQQGISGFNSIFDRN